MNATAIGLTVGIALLGLLVILIGIFPSPEDPAGRPRGACSGPGPGAATSSLRGF